MGQREERIKEILYSRKGRNTMTFIVFLAISAVLWIVMALNDEAQRDVRIAINLVNVPDSLTRITPMPASLNVSVRSRGTTMLRLLVNKRPKVNIDFRTYTSDYHFKMSDAELKAYFRNVIGGGCQVMSVNPDSLSIYYTSSKGREVPVKVDANVVPGPQHAIIGKVRSLTDSVRIFSLSGEDSEIRTVSTIPIVLNNVSSSQTLRVPLKTPRYVRAIPDSVDVHVEVEPLISKTRMVDITPVNVPHGERMILSPARVEVYYMVPMSIYKSANSDPKFTIKADFNTQKSGNKIAVTLASAPKDFVDVFLATDSVEYIMEKK